MKPLLPAPVYFVAKTIGGELNYYVGDPGCEWSPNRGKAWPMYKDQAEWLARESGGFVESAV